jgi:NADPH:quinone reductase
MFGLTGGATLQAGEQILVLGVAEARRTAAFRCSMFDARVAAALSTEEKRNFALGSGADAAIDYMRSNSLRGYHESSCRRKL